MANNAALWILTLTVAASSLTAQESRLSAGGGPEWKGLGIRFLTKAEPPGVNARVQFPGAVLVDGNGAAHHIISDDAHKRSFGYDLRLEPSADGLSAELRIEPLNAPQYSVQSGWTLMGLPKYPVIPNVRLGDTVALDLLVNPATGQKIVDYLTLIRPEGPTTGVARDFSLADVQLSVNLPHVIVAGKELNATDNSGTSAAFVWLYLKGHGRFILSLFPNEKLGFQKNGMAEGDTLTFLDGSTALRINCDSPVAPGRGPYNLYILHEPTWRAYSPADSIEIGSADDAAWIVGKH